MKSFSVLQLVRISMNANDGKSHLPRTTWKLVESMVATTPRLKSSSRIVVAVSGGADSLALLLLLSRWAAWQGGIRLAVASINHGLRPEAALEIAFVRGLANNLGLPFFLREPNADGATDEANLRKLRYQALGEIADEFSADAIATGHTREDQIETILFRLFRGGGRLGLSGMQAERELSQGRTILRPVLETSKADLLTLLIDAGIAWCEDASNFQAHYTRNRIRHGVVPAIKTALGNEALDRLPIAAKRWQTEEEYLDREAKRFAAAAVGPVHDLDHDFVQVHALDLALLRITPSALQTRVLRIWAEQAGMATILSNRQTESLSALAHGTDGSARIRVAGQEIVREYDRLFFASTESDTKPIEFKDYRFEISADDPRCLTSPVGHWTLQVDPEPAGPSARAFSMASQEIDLPRSFYERKVVLRSPVDGDRMVTTTSAAHPAHHGRTVRDIMTDCRVPERLRRDWPVLEASGEIVWIPGLSPAPTAKGGTFERGAIRLSWRHRMV